MFNDYPYMKEYKRKMEEINQDAWKYYQYVNKDVPQYCKIPFLKQLPKCKCAYHL